ncbi:class I SAM-dependent methyltransferase [Conyzicola sp.]|uniref:class I SAM-dependent methyltransferase n=1 Tax=Conyzicola sp. TaxID=1969404 RepID=UPI0039896B64
MTEVTDAVDADRALKARHRAMWASGNYPELASDLISSLGAILVEAVGVQPGDRVLDVAAGSGNASIPAAVAGGTVTASDLTPELFDVGRAQAAERGAELEWREADAEALPFADGEFDVVLSCIGVMFAPHHRVAADELVRVCRSGGRIGLLSWTPGGFVGQMLATMKPYAAAPPAGAEPPPLWGDEQHVRGLLGDRVTEVSVSTGTVTIDRFAAPDEFRQYFASHYGPTIAAYRNVGDDPERTAALDADLAALAERFDTGSDGSLVLEWEYLLLTARRS